MRQPNLQVSGTTGVSRNALETDVGLITLDMGGDHSA